MKRLSVRSHRFVEIGLGVLWCFGTAQSADIPAWWYTRGLINTNAATNDYASANVGQLKQVAYQTWVEVTNQVVGVRDQVSGVSNQVSGVESRMSKVESRTNHWNAAYITATNNQSAIGILQSAMPNYVTGTVVRVETDPVFTNSVAGKITAANTSNWTTAYRWGSHATNSYVTGTVVRTESDPLWNSASGVVYSALSSKADQTHLTNLSNQLSTADSALNAALGTLNARTSLWNTAYAWGSHATNGYLTGTVVRAESDPVWNSASGAVYSAISSNQSALGTLKSAMPNYVTGAVVRTESDPLWASASGGVYSAISSNQSAIGNLQSAMPNYVTGTVVRTESDPLWAAVSNSYATADATAVTRLNGIESQTNNWNTAYDWGSHATNGYLTSYTETDPAWHSGTGALYSAISSNQSAIGALQSAMPNYVTGTVVRTESDPVWNSASGVVYSALSSKADQTHLTNLSNQLSTADSALNAALGTLNSKTSLWNTAYGWGNHTTAGYTTTNVADSRYIHVTGDTLTGNLTIQSNLVVGTGTAAGGLAVAEGEATAASGYASHAEGFHSTASGYDSHAEGIYTTASGGGSHAEGVSNSASGYASHAAGENAKATNDNTYVWSDGTTTGSTTTKQYTVYAANGIRLLGGNVGIGTNAPSAKLDVSGNVKADGAIYKPEDVSTVLANTSAPDGTFKVTTAGKLMLKFGEQWYVFSPAETLSVGFSGMSLIPAGNFQMGDAFSEGNTNERPVHTDTISAFYMDQYEVTKAKWDEVYTWATNHGYGFSNVGSGKAPNHPVHTVSWVDCVKWANARSEKEGLAPCYTIGGSVYRNTGTGSVVCDWTTNGYRLPTEAEWEKAARGGTINHRFPWSDSNEIQHVRANYQSFQDYAYDTNPDPGWHPDYANDPSPYTSPAGSFGANGYGLYDMAGNVSEWCWDWYDPNYYTNSPAIDPHGPSSGTYRLSRGGSWAGSEFYCRVAGRAQSLPTAVGNLLGFRLVRNAY